MNIVTELNFSKLTFRKIILLDVINARNVFHMLIINQIKSKTTPLQLKMYINKRFSDQRCINYIFNNSITFEVKRFLFPFVKNTFFPIIYNETRKNLACDQTIIFSNLLYAKFPINAGLK